jgi:RNA polymerase sigma-70 factor (ECF subfamily)
MDDLTTPEVAMTRTDADLLRAARRSAAAFRELYERYAERIHAYHLRRSRSADAALDLTAETFAQAWASRSRFRDEAGGSAGPWLFGIARNVLLESVRRGRIERAACERLGVFERLDRAPVHAEPQAAWLDGLDEALAALPESQRSAIELRVLRDLDYDTVAGALSTTPRAARVRVSRGLAALRGHFTDRMEAMR